VIKKRFNGRWNVDSEFLPQHSMWSRINVMVGRLSVRPSVGLLLCAMKDRSVADTVATTTK